MSIGLRDITQLEEILEANEGDKIIVIRNGEAKLMNGADIGGGGKVTNYYIGKDNMLMATFAHYVLYADEDMTQLVTVGEACNALNSGIVYLVKGDTTSGISKVAVMGYTEQYNDESDAPVGIKVYANDTSFTIGEQVE